MSRDIDWSWKPQNSAKGKKTCSITSCDKTHQAKGLCRKHYTRLLRHGDPFGGNTSRDKSLSERFHEKYIPEPNSGCWLWTESTSSTGYGQMSHNGIMLRGHRVSYELHFGSIPKGMFICHRCDTRECVNPHHLFVGTQKENMRDMVNKDRHLRGERSPTSKLTDFDVLEIRRKRKSGITFSEITREYGVCAATAYEAATGKTWGHLS